MSLPKIEIPTIFELQTEKHCILKVGNLRFGGLMKLVEAFPDLKNPSPRAFCATFATLVVKREEGEEPIDGDSLTENELDTFAVHYLENDKELFRRNDETIEKPKTESESNIQYFTRVATDYLNSWSERFSNGAIAKVLKSSASLRTLTNFGIPRGLETIAKTHKTLSSLPAFPAKGKVEAVPVVMRSALEGIDFLSIRSPAQESNEHLARIVEHLEALPLKITQDSSPQLTSIMEQVQKIADQGNRTEVHISGGSFNNSPIGVGERVKVDVKGDSEGAGTASSNTIESNRIPNKKDVGCNYSYLNMLWRVPKLILASFAFTLLLKIAALSIEKFVGHNTAFDDAVKLLIHYPESIKAVFAFFSAVIFFLCLTLIIEPSYLGRLGRKWILIPALHVTEHMLSLVIGVFIAWFVIESVRIGSPPQSIAVLLISCIGLGGVTTLCAFAGEFLNHDFDRVIAKLGNWKFVVLLLVSLVLLWAVFSDAVWNYKPGSIQAH